MKNKNWEKSGSLKAGELLGSFKEVATTSLGSF